MMCVSIVPLIHAMTLQSPMGQINMRDSRVEEVEHISDSDSDELDNGGMDRQTPQPTLGETVKLMSKFFLCFFWLAQFQS